MRVHCLALGGVDLTSSTGKMTMQVLNAVVEFERDLLIGRTQAGLKRARAQGKVLGRRPALNATQQAEALAKIAAGVTLSQLARDYKTSITTIMRIRDAAAGDAY